MNVDVVRNGAMTIINDGNGSANVTLNALTVTHSGAGVLGSEPRPRRRGHARPTRALRAPRRTRPSTRPRRPRSTGFGTGVAQVVTLVFTFTGSATTVDPAGGQVQGDEAALRMGIDSILGSFTADDYPGPGGRTLANDGIFVSAAVPEPAAEALLAVGLIGLAWFDYSRRP